MFLQKLKVFFAVIHLLTTCYSLPLSQFYPYGVSNGDTALSPNDDGGSGKITLSTPFQYFGRYHSSLYVNTNGVISFLAPVSQYTPDRFPLGDQRRLVAPFWGDVNTRNGGVVSYRESTDTALLQRATRDIHQASFDFEDSNATWIFIATWDRVAFHGATGAMRNKVNTFQAILVSGRFQSFVIFNYNRIMWTTGTASGGNSQGVGGTPAQAGFNAGDGTRFFQIKGSRTSAIVNLPFTSNVAVPGQWIFETDGAPECVSTTAIQSQQINLREFLPCSQRKLKRILQSCSRLPHLNCKVRHGSNVCFPKCNKVPLGTPMNCKVPSAYRLMCCDLACP